MQPRAAFHASSCSVADSIILMVLCAICGASILKKLSASSLLCVHDLVVDVANNFRGALFSLVGMRLYQEGDDVNGKLGMGGISIARSTLIQDFI